MKKSISGCLKGILLFLLLLSLSSSLTVYAGSLHNRTEAVSWITDRADEAWQEDVDNAYGCQCVDLIMAYYNYLLGWNTSGNAKDYITNTLPTGWKRVYGNPSPGDIVVWDAGSLVAEGITADKTYGHIGLVYTTYSSGNIGTVETNASSKKYARYYERLTSGVACYIRPDFNGDPIVYNFVDVSNTAWFYNFVYEIADLGLMTGLDETHFGPVLTMSRAMAVTVLYRIAGQPYASSDSSFKDVKSGLWYSAAVNWAVKAGIVKGYTGNLEGCFGPEDDVTREQLAVMIFRFMNYKGYNTSARADLSGFADAGKISAYAKEAVSYAVAVSILSGASNGTMLNPLNAAQRAECAKMYLKTLDV